MRYLAYNTDGSFNGWYDSAIHKAIPTPNLEVTDDLYQTYFETMSSGQVLTVVDGKVTFNSYVPAPLTWDDIKTKRDALLAACDWTQTLDAPITSSVQKSWQNYRTVLRNIHQTYSDPSLVEWPTVPSTTS